MIRSLYQTSNLWKYWR